MWGYPLVVEAGCGGGHGNGHARAQGGAGVCQKVNKWQICGLVAGPLRPAPLPLMIGASVRP